MVDFSPEEHEEFLMHIGIKRRSGRYPWGSGSNPYQRSVRFVAYRDDLRKQGFSDAQIADHIQQLVRLKDPHETFNSSDLRAAVAISTDEIYANNSARAAMLKAKGLSNGAIAEAMGLSRTAESTVRGWLKASETVMDNALKSTADELKRQVADKPYLDVGKGNHLFMGVTSTKFLTALAMLKDEGYKIHSNILVQQLGTENKTRYKVLTAGDKTWNDARLAIKRGELGIITAQSDDGGETYKSPKGPPVSVPLSKVMVRHGDKGGAQMDGIIELRRGVPELDLGENRYAQVRIAVNGTHYLKGMAMYATDLPDGVNIRFNTNKTQAEAPNKLDAMKPVKTKLDGTPDEEHPFGSTTCPFTYVDKSGKTKNSALNFVGSSLETGNIEGRWDGWSRNLSSQMLSKQPIGLASAQLGKARAKQEEDLKTIMALTNPVVKKKLLDEYAENADAAAVHLKAAQLPRQSTHVILPMNSMRPNEVYAPNFNTGEKVALVRHPHGGPFEIPVLTVNNNNRTAKAILNGAKDAIGIHHSVAEQLSGADFDGDTVLVIPNDSGKVKARPPLEGLKGFNARAQYKIPDGDTTTPRLTKKSTQPEMGKISNLITDMSIHKAPDDEIARAVRHSMVIIDAEKHGLNYKQSAIDNNIAELKQKYQRGAGKGASTLISRASAEARIPEVKQPSGKAGINPKTGEKILIPTNRVTVTKSGKTIPRTTKGTRMGFAKKALDVLPTDRRNNATPMEQVYANHADSMKALANEARKASVALTMPKVSPAAKAVYAKEVDSLNAKLAIAQRNAPLERRAQVIGNAMARSRIDANPGIDKDDVKKIHYQSLDEARQITGAAKERVHIDANEWEAIQAGAVAHTRLAEIFNNADMKRVKELATPRARTSLTPGQFARAKALVAMGRPMSQIAEELGIPRTTIIDNLNAG